MVYLNDDIEHFDWQAALPLLSEQRREQCLKFRHELGRKTCAAAYLLLCEALRKEYGIHEPPVFEYGEHGKPVLAGFPHIHFNLSHCREAAICVVSDKPVGVDIESIHRYSESLARYVMNDDEMEEILHAENSALSFTKLWTQKEAVVKLTGHGISNDMKSVLEDRVLEGRVLEGSPFEIQTVVNAEKNYVYSITY